MDCNVSILPLMAFVVEEATNISANCTLDLTTEPPWEYPPFDASAKNIILAIVLTIIDVVTIFGNLLVLISFTMERRLLQAFNLFILNLAVTDFLVAITAMTFYTIDTLFGYWPFGKVMCGIWIYFDFAMTFASVFTLVAISIDRFWCVTWAIHYKLHNNRARTVIILAIIWVCVFLIWTPPFIGDRLKRSDEHYCLWEPSDNREFVIFVAVIGHYIPCAIMVFCYFKVFFTMKKQSNLVSANFTADKNASKSKAITSVQTGSSQDHTHPNRIPARSEIGSINQTIPSQMSQSASTSHIRDPDTQDGRSSNSREKRIFITLTYVLSSYLICWFPFYVAFDMYAWQPELVPSGLYTFFFWMTYVNSTLNPFIYAYTSKEFRQAFMKVLKLLYTCK